MKTITITIEDEVYLSCLDLIKERQLSATVNDFLKMYLKTNPKYQKSINDLDKQIKNIRLKQLTQLTKELKETELIEKDKKERERVSELGVEAIKRSGVLDDL